MKILLSAYACEPNKGSEPGVGWGFATALSKKHEVWVITRDNNKDNIESYLSNNFDIDSEKLHFIYVGLSRKLTFWKKGRRGIRLYYMMWQKKAAKIAKKWHEKIKFDLVQHVTFVSYTQPTYMYKLGIPFIFGPVSGGENIPKSIHIEMSLKEKLTETVRKASQKAALLSLSINKAMSAAKYILVATEETKSMIPTRFLEKTILMPAIGVESIGKIKSYSQENEKIKIIMAGRLIHWKAFDIGLKAFLKIADKYPNSELHILGEGDNKSRLIELAGTYLNKQVFFEKTVDHDNIYEFYKGFDIFLNTTLRDSGCMTMMEAMSVGLPCIAIATGGPKVLLSDSKESQIEPQSYNKCVAEVSDKLSNLIEYGSKRILIGKKQYEYAVNNFTYDTIIKKLERLY